MVQQAVNQNAIQPPANLLEQIQLARIEERYSDIAELIPEENRGKVFHELLFPTIISIRDIENQKDSNKEWMSQILKWRDIDKEGIKRSNSLGWHSRINMHTREEFIPMGQQFLLQATEVGRRMGLDESAEPVIVSMWANVSPYGATNRHHTHPGTFLSLAYYVQAPPGCGKICFTDPRAEANVLIPPFAMDKPRATEALHEVFYDPIPGRCVMFPSWLGHDVLPNLTQMQGDDGLRISVSANIFFTVRIGKGKMPVKSGHDPMGLLTRDGEIIKGKGILDL